MQRLGIALLWIASTPFLLVGLLACGLDWLSLAKWLWSAPMTTWALLLFIATLVAGVFGFSSIARGPALIAKLSFLVFFALTLLALGVVAFESVR